MQTVCHFIRDLNIYRIWYPWQVLELIPHGHLGQLHVYSVSIMYIYFFYIYSILREYVFLYVYFINLKIQ